MELYVLCLCADLDGLDLKSHNQMKCVLVKDGTTRLLPLHTATQAARRQLHPHPGINHLKVMSSVNICDLIFPVSLC